MSESLLAACGLIVKPHVPKRRNPYAQGVRPKKRIYWEDSRSKLQTVFVRRLNEILEARGLSDNALAKLIAGNDEPTAIQSSISRITGCKQDPTLEKVSQIVEALGISPESLFGEGESVRTRTPLVNSRAGKQESWHPVNTAGRNKLIKSTK
jgi:hypothetical protein